MVPNLPTTSRSWSSSETGSSVPRPEREPILVSACLLGCNCRYNAVVRENSALAARDDIEIVAVCPEEAGGLPTPRAAADIVEGDGASVLDGTSRVVDRGGRDVTAEFVAGAETVLVTARRVGAKKAILKSRSPSCGIGTLSTADGPRPGNGVTAELLLRHGIAVENAEFTDGAST